MRKLPFHWICVSPSLCLFPPSHCVSPSLCLFGLTVSVHYCVCFSLTVSVHYCVCFRLTVLVHHCVCFHQTVSSSLCLFLSFHRVRPSLCLCQFDCVSPLNCVCFNLTALVPHCVCFRLQDCVSSCVFFNLTVLVPHCVCFCPTVLVRHCTKCNSFYLSVLAFHGVYFLLCSSVIALASVLVLQIFLCVCFLSVVSLTFVLLKLCKTMSFS